MQRRFSIDYRVIELEGRHYLVSEPVEVDEDTAAQLERKILHSNLVLAEKEKSIYQ